MKRQHSQIGVVTSQPEAVKCPRCDSSNTKFCYYNNYNKSQPRHFCRACKRHWTNGGTLRNVPVGGGRKPKRPKKSDPDHRRRHPASPSPSDSHRNALDDDDHDRKTMSEILYQAIMSRPAPPATPPRPPALFGSSPAAGAISFPLGQALNFSAASSPFDCSNSNSISNAAGGCEFGEEQAANKVNSSNPPWQQCHQLVSNNSIYSNNNNNGFEYNYSWNFEDIDTLVSADHINLSWEDSIDNIIKP